MRSPQDEATASRPVLLGLPFAHLAGCFLGILVGSVLAAGHAALCQTIAAGGALRMEKVDEPTPLNQPLDANLRIKQNQKRFSQQDFDVVNTARQHQISDETAKLLLLALDFKARMDKLGSQPLPRELMREAEVIEILAHDVQTKVTLIVGAG